MIEHYPSITVDEFQLACQDLERKCHDRLSGTDWLSVKWTGAELQIKQSKSISAEVQASVAGNGDRVDTKDKQRPDVQSGPLEEIEEENADADTFIIPKSSLATITVEFSVTLSPTYSVPVLWFHYSEGRSLDELHRLLVPAHLHESIRNVGVLGGISQAYHPVTDMPSYFVHPCNTHEAMIAAHPDRSVTCEEYLLIWFGIIGAAVGLHIPSKIFDDSVH